MTNNRDSKTWYLITHDGWGPFIAFMGLIVLIAVVALSGALVRSYSKQNALRVKSEVRAKEMESANALCGNQGTIAMNSLKPGSKTVVVTCADKSKRVFVLTAK